MANRNVSQRPNGQNQNKICQFKLVLLGESAVGKSSLVIRFVKGQFHEFQESTIGGKYIYYKLLTLLERNYFVPCRILLFVNSRLPHTNRMFGRHNSEI